MKLTIDLNTRILSDKMQVHLVRPGAKYAFNPIVRAKSVLPTDAPLLQLEDGRPVPSASKIASQLERARVLRLWANSSKSSRGPRPSTSIESYRLDLVDPSRQATRTRIREAANQVLWTIPGGTLVVIPTRSLADDAVLAEIASRKDARVDVPGPGKNSVLTYPARKLINPKLVPMRELPIEVIKSSRTVRVVEKLSGHSEDRLLRMYYGDYQRANDRVAGIVAGTEDFDARIIGQMIELHTSIEYALQNRTALKPGQALFRPEVQNSPNFHARVDSPDGKTYLESSSIATFVVKLLLVVASAGIAPELAAQTIEDDCVTILNEASGTHQEIVDASRNALVDFAKIAGHECVATYVTALQDGLNRNAANVSGTATLDDD